VTADPRCDAEVRRVLRAYGARPQSERDELTGRLADLTARFDACELLYRGRTGDAAFEAASQHLRVARQLDTWLRDYATAAAGEHPFLDINIRDASMAQTVDWILRQEDRLVILAHNLHIQRTPYGVPWLTDIAAESPASSLGHHLTARLGNDYRVIGTTFGAGEAVGTESIEDSTGWNVRDVIRELGPAEPDSIDGLLAAATAAAGPAAAGVLDLRTLSAADAAALGGTRKIRALDHYIEVPMTEAYDALVHVPAITLWDSQSMAVLLQDDDTGQ
jgi:erythromycin esterase